MILRMRSHLHMSLRRVKACGKLVVGLVLVSSLTALLVQRHTVDLNERRFNKKTIFALATTNIIVQPPHTSSVRNATTALTTALTVDLETATPSFSSRTHGNGDLLSSSWQQALQIEREVHSVLSNLDKCLSAANLTTYFVRNGLLSKARRNAEHFITILRQNIPTVFNSSKYSSPCWETNLDMMHCTKSTRPTCPLHSISGSLGSLKYRKFNSILEASLSKALTSRYPNGLSSSVVCLPKLFLAGFPKCGSSYLYCLLEDLYPSHRMDSLVKEPHFWVPRGPFGLESTHQFPHDGAELVLYLLNFLPAVESEIDSEFSFPIDGSPNLLFQWRPYRRSEGIVNYCLTPAVLPQVLPDSKFIVVMRSPVDMLYSAFWYSCSDLNIELSRERQKKMPNEFHEKVLTKIQIFETCLQSAPLDKCMMNVFQKLGDSLKYCGRIRLEIGFYYLYIRKWLVVIPREQFLFLITEDLVTQRESIEKEILEFLDSKKVGAAHHKPIREGVRITRGSTFCNNIQTRYDYHHDPQLQMREDTRQILTAFYEPYNRELAKLLHDDKYLWAR